MNPSNKIIGLDSNSAVTVFSSITLPHETREALSESDLENYLSKAVWKCFDKLRQEAAARLNIDETDLILADARVVGVKVDGHEVLNPHGFTGKSFEITLCITMVRREVAVEAENIFEKGSTVSYLLSRVSGLKNLLYVEVGESATTIFLTTPLRTSYLSEFDWGKADLIKSYKKYFELDDGTVWQLFQLYTANNVSVAVSEKMDKIFKESFRTFLNGLTMCVRNFEDIDSKKLPPIYLKGAFLLPAHLYLKDFSLHNKRVKFREVNPDVEIEDLVYNYSYNVYDWLNQLARRRIKWLMPQ
ncbi:MAG: hypothetical protein HYR95_02695 [Candidatus Colwellbacteria bacterium]|nr:hypothetical protein [Candidatus Colwellbacteria bacterium]